MFVQIKAYAWSKAIALANSRLQFLENSFRRTGNVENKFATETQVPRYDQYSSLILLWGPTFADATFLEMMTP